MDDNIGMIGRNAGMIWENLNENGSLLQKNIRSKTDLKNNEFHMAVGWLARENKINKSQKNNTYQLGESNIADDIGCFAEKVSNELQDQSKKNVATIAKSAELRPKEVYMALGWLAREDKLEIFQDRTLQKKYSLKK